MAIERSEAPRRRVGEDSSREPGRDRRASGATYGLDQGSDRRWDRAWRAINRTWPASRRPRSPSTTMSEKRGAPDVAAVDPMTGAIDSWPMGMCQLATLLTESDDAREDASASARSDLEPLVREESARA